MGLEDLRARAKDRQTKPAALGTYTERVCLEPVLLDELDEAQAALEIEKDAAGDGPARLGGRTPDPEVKRLEKAVADAEEKVRLVTWRLVFRSLGSDEYNDLLAFYPDADQTQKANAAFTNALADWSLFEAFEPDPEGDGEKPVVVQEMDHDTGLPKGKDGLRYSTDIAPIISIGMWDLIAAQLVALNRRDRTVRPFSSKPSPPKRTRAATSRRQSSG